ncbi:Y-family DNA polymerase [Liquorilactobacillus mali]|uniref:ImpB MucB SamB family protein UvrX n=1 Tax=Liquorilactobacillus mali TaxID=1618 RepID=A0A0R2FPT9_9LACO|nr:Y-family DNA polymerase [Liquorilactobacillus mali]KRN27004.1 ImpB MucB SamB family protein UvrX [Liquorilactobacillus mali]MDN7144970.1 Y-family DNA polymerase [Liquorilactobacillus mali]
MNYQNEPHGVFFMIDNKSFYASVESIQRGLNPLKSVLVVMSEQKNTNGGLVLAASPSAKRIFNIKNVDRHYDLPIDPRLLVVPPRMNLYIEKNLVINKIFNRFVAETDLYPYSIDESILDLTHSWKLFGSSPLEVACLIQKTVRKETGLYTAIGIGENPIQAKLALDIYAKKSPLLISKVSYDNFGSKFWNITELTSFWSIGKRTAKRLKKLSINSLFDLAHTNPFRLKKEFGIIGTQLFALAWGIDRSNLCEFLNVKNPSVGNSQVLPRDYIKQSEIEVVIKEIGQQVAARIRHIGRVTGCVHLGIGFSLSSIEHGYSGFAHELKILPTDNTQLLTEQLLFIFRSFWQGEPIRHVAVSYSQLSPKLGDQLSLFENTDLQLKKIMFNSLIDRIRERFGVEAIMYANSLLKGGTFIQRQSLVGGHNGGNSFE